ncbi:MAG: hypothetical protein VW268_00840 [Rhodospirillaceae bacterium]
MPDGDIAGAGVNQRLAQSPHQRVINEPEADRHMNDREQDHQQVSAFQRDGIPEDEKRVSDDGEHGDQHDVHAKSFAHDFDMTPPKWLSRLSGRPMLIGL